MVIASIFSDFYLGTLGIILASMSVAIPVIVLFFFGKKAWYRYQDDYFDEQSFRTLSSEEVIELLLELKTYLEENQDYEIAKIVAKAHADFLQRKTSIKEIFEKFVPIDYVLEKGETDPYPERKAIVVDTFTAADEEREIKVFLEIREPLSLSERVRSFILE